MRALRFLATAVTALAFALGAPAGASPEEPPPGGVPENPSTQGWEPCVGPICPVSIICAIDPDILCD